MPERPRARFCDASTPPLLTPHGDVPEGFGGEAALGSVIELAASSSSTGHAIDAAAVVQEGEPKLMRGVWAPAARTWTWSDVRERLRGHVFADVHLTDGYHYAPADSRASLHGLLGQRHSTAQVRVRNLSAEVVLDALLKAEQMQSAHPGVSADAPDAQRRAFWRRRWAAESPPSSPTRRQRSGSSRARANDANEGGGEVLVGGTDGGNGSHLIDLLQGRRLLHFDTIPFALEPALRPQEPLYVSTYDSRQRMQYMWLSSPGMRTHTHFDSDRNMFVQLIGRKRFVLWPPNQTARLCMYPRLHPLWHKSRADFEAPETTRLRPCREYGHSQALGVSVQAGDVLYVPPYWWHTVETLTPSLSLSTLSRWPQLYNHLNAIYRHTYAFDALAHYPSRVYALRAYLTRLALRAKLPQLFDSLAAQYEGLEHLFRAGGRGAAPGGGCSLDARGTPLSRSVLGRVDFDVTMIWNEHLAHLPPDVRAVALPEYVEEVTAEALGAAEVLPFWRECFGPSSPPFFLTHPGSEEHIRLWRQ